MHIYYRSVIICKTSCLLIASFIIIGAVNFIHLNTKNGFSEKPQSNEKSHVNLHKLRSLLAKRSVDIITKNDASDASQYLHPDYNHMENMIESDFKPTPKNGLGS